MRRMVLLALVPVLLAGCDKVDLPFLAKSDTQLIQGAWACTSDEGHGLAGLTLNFGKDGKALLNMKGETKGAGGSDDINSLFAIGVDVDVNLDYALTGKTLAMKATGGKVNKITLNGEAVDLAKMGGADAVQKKMVEDMKMDDSTVEALDAQQLVLKTKDGAKVSCKRPAA